MPKFPRERRPDDTRRGTPSKLFSVTVLIDSIAEHVRTDEKILRAKSPAEARNKASEF